MWRQPAPVGCGLGCQFGQGKGDWSMQIRVPRARLAVIALMIAVVAIVAVVGAAAATKDNKVMKVGFASPAKPTDFGWNAQGFKGAKAAASQNGASFDAITNIGYDKTDVVLRQLIKQGANFIVAHASGYDTIAARLAQQYKVPMMTYDVATNLKKGSVSYITTSSQEGAYLAGILAAKTTKTKKVGIVISAADDNWYKMSGGFAQGFRSVDKTSKIYFATISPTGYDDAAGGKRVASSVIAQGADVIFTMGDNASFGYLQAIGSAKVGHKVWMIGDIGDMSPIDKSHVFLSSVLWNFTKVYSQAIKDVNAGTYGTHGYNLDLANGGVSLLKTKYVSAPAWAAVTLAQKGILSGKIKITVTHNAKQVQALIK
jgi:basic membrane protein A and related proteins